MMKVNTIIGMIRISGLSIIEAQKRQNNELIEPQIQLAKETKGQ